MPVLKILARRNFVKVSVSRTLFHKEFQVGTGSVMYADIICRQELIIYNYVDRKSCFAFANFFCIMPASFLRIYIL